MPEEQLTLKKAIELNRLDKFADQQDAWLREKGFVLRPEIETIDALSTTIRPEKSEDRT